jgi:hypothetical protein
VTNSCGSFTDYNYKRHNLPTRTINPINLPSCPSVPVTDHQGDHATGDAPSHSRRRALHPPPLKVIVILGNILKNLLSSSFLLNPCIHPAIGSSNCFTIHAIVSMQFPSISISSFDKCLCPTFSNNSSWMPL